MSVDKTMNKKPWFPVMESAIKVLCENDVDCVAFVVRLSNGETMTAYYNACMEDKARMVSHMQSDILMDIIGANSSYIRSILDNAEGEIGQDEDDDPDDK